MTCFEWAPLAADWGNASDITQTVTNVVAASATIWLTFILVRTDIRRSDREHVEHEYGRIERLKANCRAEFEAALKSNRQIVPVCRYMGKQSKKDVRHVMIAYEEFYRDHSGTNRLEEPLMLLVKLHADGQKFWPTPEEWLQSVIGE